MGSVLPAPFYGASSITTGDRFSWSKQCTKNCYAGSYETTLWHKTRKIQKEYCVMMSSRHNLKRDYKVIDKGTSFQECKKKHIVNAISEQSFENEPQAREAQSIWDSVKDAVDAFYTFTRPYAAIATVLCSLSVSLLAANKLSDLSLPFFIGCFEAVVATFIMHFFNCGLNQLCDIEIDKINKPYLPLASGELSFRSGIIIVASSLILSFWLGWIIGSWPLFWVIFSNFVFSAAYSINLPLLRWKKSPVLTAMNFIVDGAIARPIGYFLHMQTYVFKRPATFPRPLIFCIAILSLFYVVVALIKDIPDVEGDKKFGIQSLASRLGQKQVFWICTSLLQMAYGITILVGAMSPFLWSKIFTGLGHAILASVLWNHAKSVDLKSNAALQSFYMFIWKLLCAEYFLIPLFR